MLRLRDYFLQPDEGLYWLRWAPRNFREWLFEEQTEFHYGDYEPPDYYPSRFRVATYRIRELLSPSYWKYLWDKDR